MIGQLYYYILKHRLHIQHFTWNFLIYTTIVLNLGWLNLVTKNEDSVNKRYEKIKNNLFRQYLQHGTPELKFKYKQYRNNLNRMLRIAEREHYDVLFSNYKGNLKKSWILLKEVINRNKTRDCSSKFLLNDECISDKLKIAIDHI